MTQIEAVINNRPVTAISNASTDDIPLRPIDFLQNNLKYSLAETNSEQGTDPTFDPKLIQTAAQAKHAIQHAEQISSKFWDRWYTEYFALREMQAINRKQPRHVKHGESQIDEIVLVEQENLPGDAQQTCMATNCKQSLSTGNFSKKREVPLIRPQADHNVREFQMNEGNKPRLAKIKAKKAIQEISRVTDDSDGSLLPISCPHINVVMIIMITVVFRVISDCLLMRRCRSSNIPLNGTFQLGIQSTCRHFANN
ncbi:hypothetical protein V3C99_013723 [Haemonchus contortus]|uniref:DUF5641 domain-containing protein n=1 Tax=Haemonchus contortus TaxID=6289 RepID=A0A7I4Y1Q4_HAECO